jgi:histone acetyltransferase MCC1
VTQLRLFLHSRTDTTLDGEQALYIMTLGILNQYRRKGLGRLLLEKCILHARGFPCCGAVYLHVITSNRGAIRFYESNDFQRLRELEGYYVIAHQRFNSFLYILYINGASSPHSSWFRYWRCGVLLRSSQMCVSQH